MASSKTVDSALWWDPFTTLLTDLENASLSAEAPPSMVKKLKDNHSWFLETVFLFRKLNEKSREALNSQQVQVGSHWLSVKPELKEKALQISAFLVSLLLVEIDAIVARIVKMNVQGMAEPVKYLRNGKIIMLNRHHKVVCYDPSTGTVKRIDSCLSICDAISIKPSLVPLKVMLGDNMAGIFPGPV